MYIYMDAIIDTWNLILYGKLQEDVETEMRRLKLELKQTMEMYSTACKEALTAKQKVQETISTERLSKFLS